MIGIMLVNQDLVVAIDGKIHSLREAFQEGKAQSGLVPPEHMGTAEPRYPET